MRDLCYLHGFVERSRRDNATEKFVGFFVPDTTQAAEEAAFAEAWQYMQRAQPCAIFYYSKYERTIYRKLQGKYPGVCSAADIEALFEPTRTVDLYSDVVKRCTEWPTRDFSIKTLARYLGFSVARHATLRRRLDPVVRRVGEDGFTRDQAAHPRVQRG